MVTVQVPATTANFGSGFDCIGLALNLYNYIEMDFSSKPEVVVKGYGKKDIETDERNLVYKAAKKVLSKKNIVKPLKITLCNNIPITRGLGSSAAAITGGMVAANALIGNPITSDEILELATEMEGHPDNVVPAFLGGFCISASKNDTIFYKKISFPKDICFVVAIPHFHLETQKARKVMPKQVSIQDAVFNMGRCALLVAAIFEGDLTNISEFCKDRIHQTHRAKLIPGMEKIINSAKTEGALASFLSGAGPSVVCLSNKDKAKYLGDFMVQIFSNEGIPAEFEILHACNTGTKIIKVP